MADGKSEGDKKIVAYKKHGLTETRLYKIWMDMKTRCRYKKDKSYQRYGGRGIKVCDEWQSFVNFYDWSIVNGYSDDLTLDRIDNNGNYEPSNCRWITRKEQANNRKSNRKIEFNGEIHNIREWSELLGVSYSTLSARLNKYKWTVEEAFTIEIRPRGWNLENGKARSIHTK